MNDAPFHRRNIDETRFFIDPHMEVVKPRSKSAAEIVQQAANEIAQRGSLRDKPDGERSMKRCVDAFNGLVGRQALSETEGWLFMCVLKMARATAGKFHVDDYTDLAGYAGLAGECAANDDVPLKFNVDYGKYGTDG
jgi:hypothetical protein